MLRSEQCNYMMVLKTEQYTILVTLIIRKALTVFSFLSCGLKCGYSWKDIKEKLLLILDDSENSLEETNKNIGCAFSLFIALRKRANSICDI